MKKIKKVERFKTRYGVNSINNQEVIKEKQLENVSEYDINGNLISDISYDKNGDIIEKVLFKYDDKNLKQQQQLFSEYSDQPTEDVTYEYDGDSVLQFQNEHYMDGSLSKTKHVWDGDLLLAQITHDEDMEFEGKIEYKYDEKKMISQEEFDEDEKLVSYTHIDIDKQEKTNTIEKKDFEDIISRKVEYFDDADRLEKSETYDGKNTLLESIQIKYDTNNNVVGYDRIAGFGKEVYSMVLDDKGNELERKAVDDNDEEILIIKNNYSDDGLLLTSTNYISNRGMKMDEEYEIENKYEFFE